MVVYYEGWRTVILKSVESNQLIRVFWKKKPIYKPLLHLLGLEKTPIFYNDAPCGWAVHWRKIVLCIRKERKKSRVNKNPLNFCSLVFIERSQNYEEAYQHLAIHCENLTQVISGVLFRRKVWNSTIILVHKNCHSQKSKLKSLDSAIDRNYFNIQSSFEY